MVFAVLIFEVGVALLTLLGSEIFIKLWTFIQVAQLIFKVDTSAVLTPIKRPGRKKKIRNKIRLIRI